MESIEQCALKPVVQIAPLRDQSRDGRTLRVIRQK